MSLRKGITATEEVRMQKAIEAGKSWEEVLADLDDVEADYVLENLYTPMKAAHEASKKSEKPVVKSAPAGTVKL